ncbi:MAG: hypothetical protein KatS3mg093_006 [Candidatus Parcubacteria bacterium]|nr:MAG: hypothetical protein KatS3mg093_006 [Candidatus Parcubacteria bacterium]
MKEVQKLGFEVWGIDFDKKSIEVAKNKFGLKNVFPMSLDEFVDFAKEKDLKFDVITFFEVLEHQDKPREFLEQIKILLKPGGLYCWFCPKQRWFFKKIRRIAPSSFLMVFLKNLLKKFLK